MSSHLEIRPATLGQANELVALWHRHHKPATGHRFSIGVFLDGEPRGAAIIGRPPARMTDQFNVCEVVRLVTDGTRNACSILYAAAAAAARAMGYARIQTFILESEPGTSLKAAGWRCLGPAGGGTWSRPSRGRIDAHPLESKVKWVKDFKQPYIDEEVIG